MDPASASATIAALRPAELRLVLAGLRHRTSIDIREQGSVRCSIAVDTVRLLGPVKWTNGVCGIKKLWKAPVIRPAEKQRHGVDHVLTKGHVEEAACAACQRK
jgi:hypothetical protein